MKPNDTATHPLSARSSEAQPQPGAALRAAPGLIARRSGPGRGLATTPKVRYFLVPDITVSTPGSNQVTAGSFTVSGTASCEKFKDEGAEEVSLGDASETLTSITVTVPGLGVLGATPQGPADAPWTAWVVNVSGAPEGTQVLAVKAFASDSGVDAGGAERDVPVRVDLTPPTLTVNPPSDVVQPAPPYVATISGTAADALAGVAAVEYQVSGGAFVAAGGTTAWVASVTLPGLGLFDLAFRARDAVGNVGALQAVQVRVGDVTPPSLAITAPAEGETFTLTDDGLTLELRGTASDTQTAVSRVEWALDDGAFVAALPKADGDWTTWSATVGIADAGDHVISVRAYDGAQPEPNRATQQVHVVVAKPFESSDPESVFGPTTYLKELLEYATQRVKSSPDGAFITRPMLIDACLQPFDELVHRDLRGAATAPVNPLRVGVEVLRRYLARNALAVPAQAEADYRFAAYEALLAGLGTSYEEIRLARVADDGVRAALAGRLGIGLAQFRPDRLDALLLQPQSLAETDLQTLFGLETTQVKPLADSVVPPGQLVLWQQEHLRNLWQQQDDAARTDFGTPTPVIDPDLLSATDLRTASAGDAAFDLWQARAADVAAHLATLDAQRKAAATQQAGFDAIVGGSVAPIDDLLALQAARSEGEAIDDTLRAWHLDAPAFVHLMRLRELALADGLLESEWEDVCAIVAQVRKIGLHAAWRAEEQGRGVILGPDLFVAAPAAGSPALPAWRAPARARQTWRETLDARVQQDSAVAQALQAVVADAEAAALPALRDACVAATAPDQDPAMLADRLSRELAIDCRDAGKLRTSRVQQALETLQALMFSLRMGRLKDLPPVAGVAHPAADWVLALEPDRLTEAGFDEEWRWMGGYANWIAAIRVFAYPESYLMPSLRPAGQSAAFVTLTQALRNQSRLTPLAARTLAQQYLKDLGTEMGTRLPPELHDGALTLTEALTDTELAQRRSFIAAQFGDVTVPAQVPPHLPEIFFFVPMSLALQLQQAGQFLAALDWIETVYTDHFAAAERKIYRGLVLEETIPTHYQRNPDHWLREQLNPHEIAATRTNAYTRFTLISLVRIYLDYADAEFARDDAEAVVRARSLYVQALQLLALPEMQAPGSGADASPFPPNPVPLALRLRAELNLAKLRDGRNIAGIAREAVSYLGLSTPSVDGLPAAGRAGVAPVGRPTPYRYGVLIERARNLVSIAQQVEQAFLAALEKRDAETYNLMKAGQDLKVAAATVDLHALQVAEADQGIGLAELQRDRAAIQRDTYQSWISAGLNRWEQGTLDDYRRAGQIRNLLAETDAMMTTTQALVSASAGGFLGTGLGGSLWGVGAVGMLASVRAGQAQALNNVEVAAQIGNARASYERRSQEWELQRQLAQADVGIGERQVSLAGAHRDVAVQEQRISSIQRDHAQATVDFLAHKFTNAELYAWMSSVLNGAYSYFLQQATAMAQLAQQQLGFERQQRPPAFIQADYWDPDSNAAAAGASTSTPDRQGLTGSVRLLQDITRLDQFAFDSNRRRLQLSETFSLARLFPVEFQRFRETGVLQFATPMALFDSGFPGHYLRLIKRVRLSMMALVPPVRGVRATLQGSGLSRVVTGGDVFQTQLVRRDPEQIAFTSTANATGLLDLEPEEGLLKPFEGMGVDTTWMLQLPRAANPFAFDGISDVLFSIDYTALQDGAYRRQVIQQLDNRVSAERVLSLRDQYPDQWYALHNPEQSDPPLAARFALAAADFPPNLQDLRVQQVMLAVCRASGQVFEVGPVELSLQPAGGTPAVNGTVASTVDGVASTRRGNGSAWLPFIGQSPAGQWAMTFADSPDLRDRFASEQIDDVLLVLTYEGRTPDWPQ